MSAQTYQPLQIFIHVEDVETVSCLLQPCRNLRLAKTSFGALKGHQLVHRLGSQTTVSELKLDKSHIAAVTMVGGYAHNV